MGASKPVLWLIRLFWVLLFGLSCTFLGPSFVRNLRPSRTYILDFVQEWASARNHFEGQPIYLPQEISYRLYLGYERQPGEFFLERNAHPPTSVLLILPLACLDYPDAFMVWGLISLGALALAGWIAVRQLALRPSPWAVFPVVALLLLCNPFRQQMNQGQLNLLLLVLVTGVWASSRSGRPYWAGVWLGLATAVKLFPGFLFLHFLVRKEWRTVAAGIATFAGVSALTVLVLGPGAYREYVEDVMPVVAAYRDWWPNASLLGFWAKLFDGASGKVTPLWYNPPLAQGLYLLTAGLLAIVVARSSRDARSRNEQDHAFCLAMVGMLLVSPVTWDHYFTILFLPLLVLWARLPATGLGRAIFWVLLILLWLPPIMYWRPATGARMENWQSLVASPGQTLTALAIQTYTLLGLFLLVWSQRREAERTVPENSGA